MLRDLRVIELATYIAAPGAAGIMADWGADVIKIESPDGDPMRGFFDTLGSDQAANPVFELDNRGKRSVVLDIRTPAGRDAAKALVRDADIFLTNVRPAGLARAGLDYDSLKAVNPRLIYCSLTGYGLEGPDADRPGMDVAAFWSRAGVGAITAPKGAEPFPIRTGMGDHVTSLATVAAVLAAVHERQRTGVGRLVETSLLRTGVYAIGSDMAIQLRFGKLASTRPRREAVQPWPISSRPATAAGSACWPARVRPTGRGSPPPPAAENWPRIRAFPAPACAASMAAPWSTSSTRPSRPWTTRRPPRRSTPATSPGPPGRRPATCSPTRRRPRPAASSRPPTATAEPSPPRPARPGSPARRTGHAGRRRAWANTRPRCWRKSGGRRRRSRR